MAVVGPLADGLLDAHPNSTRVNNPNARGRELLDLISAPQVIVADEEKDDPRAWTRSTDTQWGTYVSSGALNHVPELACEFHVGHAVYMHRHMAPVRDLDNLTVEQRRFLGGVAARIPRLIEAVQAGTATASFKLGTRRLDDGRHIELELVARVPESEWDGVAKSWGKFRRGRRRTRKRNRSTAGWEYRPCRFRVCWFQP